MASATGRWARRLSLVSMAMVAIDRGPVRRPARARQRDRSDERSARRLLFYAFAYLAFLYVPVLFLPLFSFNNSEFIAFPLSRLHHPLVCGSWPPTAPCSTRWATA